MNHISTWTAPTVGAPLVLPSKTKHIEQLTATCLHELYPQ